MTKLKIDIVSDVACPWCPIGYERLEAAMQELASDGLAFEVAWRPFELAPDMPSEGEEIVPHLVRKYGRSAAEVVASLQQIIAAARALDLDFDGALRRRAVNTLTGWLAAASLDRVPRTRGRAGLECRVPRSASRARPNRDRVCTARALPA